MESAPSWRHRGRLDAVAELLQALWGDALPPGPAPWRRIATDAVAADDQFGIRNALAVQGDELALSVLDEVLSYIPAGSSLLGALRPELAERVRRAREDGDPGAWIAAAHARLLSQALRATAARCAAVYRHQDDQAVLDASLGMSTWERTQHARLALLGPDVPSAALRQALEQGHAAAGDMPVPTTATRWDDTPELVPAPCIAVPFPTAAPQQRAAGAVLVIWGPEGDPELDAVAHVLAPLAAEAEHLLTAA